MTGRPTLAARFGWQPTEDEPGALAFVADAAGEERLRPVAEAFRRIGARAGFTVCRLDGSGMVVPPVFLPRTAELFLSSRKVRAVLVADGVPAPPPHLAAALARRGTPVLRLADAASPDAAAAELVAMIGRERGPRGGFIDRAAQAIAPGDAAKPKSFLFNVLASRLEAIDEVAGALGRPRRILCLGNGPSSEDPTATAFAHDALFRANHGWLTRGVLTGPDIVFTGVKASMRALHGPILGLHGETAEVSLLATRLARPWRGRVRYFLAGRIADPLPRFDWGPHRPTSGAVMIATAVALAPEALAIAGIDLFASAAGAYPGDRASPNAYAPAHDRDRDLAYILGCLDLHRGSLEIHGEALRAAAGFERRGHIG